MISHMDQGVRFVTGMGICILWYDARGRGALCYGHLDLHLTISQTRQGIRIDTGIGLHIL